METPIDFHRFAVGCVQFAEKSQTIEDKELLLSMAQVWIRLAEKADHIQAILDAP